MGDCRTRYDVSRKRAGFVLLILALLAVLALVLAAASIRPAQAGEAKCLKTADFAASIVKSGGTATPIPADKLAITRRLVGTVNPKHEVRSFAEMDAAFLDTMPDGSSAILLAKQGCLGVIWLTPRFVPLADLQKMLLGEKIAAPPTPGAIHPDRFERLNI